MMTLREDQELDLLDKVLLKKYYVNGFRKMEREHCEICCAVFGSGKYDFSEGYCTQNYHYWICDRCYNEKKDEYHWVIQS